MERHCVVLAGGLGTRVRQVTRDLLPKVLIPVNGRPFIDFKLLSLARMGVTHVTVLAGQHGDQVVKHFQSFRSLPIEVSTVLDGDQLLGTAGAVARVMNDLPDQFWVTYGDSFVTADLDAIEDTCGDGMLRVMTVLHNHDVLERSNTTVCEGKVTRYFKPTKPGEHEWLDYGLLRFARQDFASVSLDQPTDLSEVIESLVISRSLHAWEVVERFWEIGSPEALSETSAEFARRDWADLW